MHVSGTLAIVVAPQPNENWPPVRLREGRLPEILVGPGRDRLAIEIVESLAAELPVDRTRIHGTGHSMGGAGTWHVLAQRPDLFATDVPVCGRAHPATLARLKDVPIWNFHGEKDGVEPAETSRCIIAELRTLGGRPLYTEVPGVGHNHALPGRGAELGMIEAPRARGRRDVSGTTNDRDPILEAIGRTLTGRDAHVSVDSPG